MSGGAPILRNVTGQMAGLLLLPAVHGASGDVFSGSGEGLAHLVLPGGWRVEDDRVVVTGKRLRVRVQVERERREG